MSGRTRRCFASSGSPSPRESACGELRTRQLPGRLHGAFFLTCRWLTGSRMMQGHRAGAWRAVPPRPRRPFRRPTARYLTSRAATQRSSAPAEAWFGLVAIAQQQRLPKSVYLVPVRPVRIWSAIAAALRSSGSRRVIGATNKRDLSTTGIGQEVSLPVIIRRPVFRRSSRR